MYDISYELLDYQIISVLDQINRGIYCVLGQIKQMDLLEFMAELDIQQITEDYLDDNIVKDLILQMLHYNRMI